MSQKDVYRDVFRDRFGMRTWIATWRPGADLRLGMAGRIKEGEFVAEYDVRDRGVKLPDPPKPDDEPDEYQWSTEGGVEFLVKAAGETSQAFKSIAAADVGFKLQFTKQDAMAMVYRNVIEQRLGDERAIAEEMVKSWQGGPWPKMQIGDVVITQLLIARWGFAFGASSRGASVELKLDASVGKPGASLADVKGKVGVSWQQETSFAALSVQGGLPIGYRCLELKQEGFWFPKTVAKPRLEAFAAQLRESELPGVDAQDLILSSEEFSGG